MTRFTRALWPGAVRNPLRKLVIGLIVAPLIVAAVLTSMAFLVAGMSEHNFSQVMLVTFEAAIALILLSLLFTLTFGLMGIAVLWWTEQRNATAWTTGGILTGALAGMLFAELLLDGLSTPILIAFALSGWAVFLLIRYFAGIQDEIETDLDRRDQT